MNMRNLLRKMGRKSFRPGQAAAMFMLNATNPETIRVARRLMVNLGFKAQRAAADAMRLAGRRQTAQPPATVGTAPLREQVIHFVNKKLPGGLPKRSARALLDIEDKHYVPIIRDPAATTPDSEAVFYFPGCGSERLFSQVGLATQAMLWRAGVQTVLPPGYLCCGYPQRGAGQYDRADKTITDNRVLFHRVANTLNYLDIKTVVVSCGTCYDQLQGYKFDEIFPGSRIVDIHEFLLEKGITLSDSLSAEANVGEADVKRSGRSQKGSTAYLYHDPCHSPLKQREPMLTVKALIGDRVLQSDRCCGESGTFGVTRPDIATQVRFRKEEELRKGEAALREGGATGNLMVLTSCPSCLQGLARYQGDLQSGLLQADYIVVEMARRLLGASWMEDYVVRANAGGIERVLV
jgi:Fe-S oxidoreductase